jgi:hypothetical protein
MPRRAIHRGYGGSLDNFIGAQWRVGAAGIIAHNLDRDIAPPSASSFHNDGLQAAIAFHAAISVEEGIERYLRGV